MRPEPTSPPRPKISPRRTLKLTPSTAPRRLRSRTSKTTSPTWCSGRTKMWPVVLPTMAEMTCSLVQPATGKVATLRPSLKTVIRSAISKISLMKWLM